MDGRLVTGEWAAARSLHNSKCSFASGSRLVARTLAGTASRLSPRTFESFCMSPLGSASLLAGEGLFRFVISQLEDYLMLQADLYRSVSRATGESVATIKRLGFLIADPDEPINDPEAEFLGPHVIDWDAFHAAQDDINAESTFDL